MKIEEILNEYLGKQTKVALMELPNIAKELNYHFDCERVNVPSTIDILMTILI